MDVIVKGSKVRLIDVHNLCKFPVFYTEYKEGTNVLDEKIDLKILSEYDFIVEGIFYNSTDLFMGESRQLMVRILDTEEFKHRRFIIPEWMMESV